MSLEVWFVSDTAQDLVNLNKYAATLRLEKDMRAQRRVHHRCSEGSPFYSLTQVIKPSSTSYANWNTSFHIICEAEEEARVQPLHVHPRKQFEETHAPPIRAST